MIKPTVGRVVWYRPQAGDIAAGTKEPLAAIVTYVHSDRMVNLVVFDANGFEHRRTSIVLHQENDEFPQRSYCEWMPYQKGQAAKTEAPEKELASPPADMKAEVTLLQFGQSNAKRFLLWSIDIGGNRWEVDSVFPLVCPIEYELVLRQDGHQVKVIQRKRDRVQQLEATVAKPPP